MYFFIILLACFYSTHAGEHILRLKENSHLGTTLIGVEEGSSVFIRCEHPNQKYEKLRWLHNGTPIDAKYVHIKDEASYVIINKFDKNKHSGVYECSSNGMSASYRLKSEKFYELPDGFRYCFGEEMANCDHSDVCQVEISTGITSCVCEQGWMGVKCDIIDSVRLHSVVTHSACASWPILVTAIIFVTVLALLATCVYKFKVRNPHRYTKKINHKPPIILAEDSPQPKSNGRIFV